MKRFLNKIILCAVVVCLIIGVVGSARTPIDTANQPKQLLVTANVLNVRCGPGTNFIKVGEVYRNNIITCLGKLGTWYVVQLDSNVIGMVSADYVSTNTTIPIKTPTPTTAPTPTKTPTPTSTPTATKTPTPTITASPSDSLTSDEKEMLDLINAERAKAGLSALTANMEVVKVARIKAQEMVDKNYFSHTSPTYGSPFDMLKKFGISYKSAGENIAANSTVKAAHTSLMNSQGHRENILNKSYNQIGIGIVSSPKYGKMFVQMFIGK